MYVDKKRKKWPARALAGAGLLIAIGLWRLIVPASGRDMDEESERAIKAAVERCAMQCYVVEGAYPPSLDYLKERYGLQIDEERYTVKYFAFAENLMPDITVLENKP